MKHAFFDSTGPAMPSVETHLSTATAAVPCPQVDQAATPAGEWLRRRHDAQGKMCYWLQAPADAQHGECVARV